MPVKPPARARAAVRPAARAGRRPGAAGSGGQRNEIAEDTGDRGKNGFLAGRSRPRSRSRAPGLSTRRISDAAFHRVGTENHAEAAGRGVETSRPERPAACMSISRASRLSEAQLLRLARVTRTMSGERSVATTRPPAARRRRGRRRLTGSAGQIHTVCPGFIPRRRTASCEMPLF